MYKTVNAVTEENVHEAAVWLTEEELASRLNDMNSTTAAEVYLAYEVNDQGELFSLLREGVQQEVQRIGMGDDLTYDDKLEKSDWLWAEKIATDLNEKNAYRVMAGLMLSWRYGDKFGLEVISPQRVRVLTCALVEAVKKASKKELLDRYVAEITDSALEFGDALPVQPGWVLSLRGIGGVVDALAKVRGGDLRPSDVVTWLQRSMKD